MAFSFSRTLGAAAAALTLAATGAAHAGTHESGFIGADSFAGQSLYAGAARLDDVNTPFADDILFGGDVGPAADVSSLETVAGAVGPDNTPMTPATVPEPGNVAMMLAGILSLVGVTRRRGMR